MNVPLAMTAATTSSSSSNKTWYGGPLEENTFRILIATDQHIGHKHLDQVRTNDAMNAWREILDIALEQKVDFILQGGDLFDENVPSRRLVYDMSQLLRDKCLNSRPVQMRYVSDGAVNFWHSQFPHPNYEDPNLNVGLPIFAIHGNHDDQSGSGLCALDEFHSTGLINFFGKMKNLKKFEIEPVLLEKGMTKLALYGLGAQKDIILQRAFGEDKVIFKRPGGNEDDWFNLFVLHQTRTDYGRNNKYISDHHIPSFVDMTVWGHEHRAMVDPALPENVREPKQLSRPDCLDGKVGYVMQPGSTIQTSLDRAEAGDKYCVLLEVRGRLWKHTPIALKRIRQFMIPPEDVVLAKLNIPNIRQGDGHVNHNTKVVKDYCAKLVNDLLVQAERERLTQPERPLLPMIRIRVDAAEIDMTVFNVKQFGEEFYGKVANPDTLLKLINCDSKLRRFHVRRGGGMMSNGAYMEMKEQNARDHQTTVEDMITDYFGKIEEREKQLNILSEGLCNKAAKHYILNKEKFALREIFKSQATKIQKALEDNCPNDSGKDDVMSKLGQINEIRQQVKQGFLSVDQVSANNNNNKLSGSRNDHQSLTGVVGEDEGMMIERPNDLGDALNVTSKFDMTDTEIRDAVSRVDSLALKRGSKAVAGPSVASSSRTTSSAGRGRGRGSKTSMPPPPPQRTSPPASSKLTSPPPKASRFDPQVRRGRQDQSHLQADRESTRGRAIMTARGSRKATSGLSNDDFENDGADDGFVGRHEPSPIPLGDSRRGGPRSSTQLSSTKSPNKSANSDSDAVPTRRTRSGGIGPSSQTSSDKRSGRTLDSFVRNLSPIRSNSPSPPRDFEDVPDSLENDNGGSAVGRRGLRTTGNRGGVPPRTSSTVHSAGSSSQQTSAAGSSQQTSLLNSSTLRRRLRQGGGGRASKRGGGGVSLFDDEDEVDDSQAKNHNDHMVMNSTVRDDDEEDMMPQFRNRQTKRPLLSSSVANRVNHAVLEEEEDGDERMDDVIPETLSSGDDEDFTFSSNQGQQKQPSALSNQQKGRTVNPRR